MIKREFIRSYTERFGPDFVENFSNAISEPYKDYIRVNTLKIAPEKLIKRLEAKGFRFTKFQELSYCYRVEREPFGIASTPEYLLGYFYVQDAASMMPVAALDPKPNETVLDCCGAPGGKCTHMAQLMNNSGVIASVDIDESRLKAEQFNIQRLGVKNTAVFLLDARSVKKIGLLFDKIIVDPPCSASGIVWKEKKRLKSINKQQVWRFAKIQREILSSAVKCLKKDGTLVYSTCSLEAEENEENTRYAEKELKLKLVKWEYFFPHVHQTHGFYYALFKKE